MTAAAPPLATPRGRARTEKVAVEALAARRRFRGGRGVGPVTLRVGAGEVVGLMGPNGAGKTTLLRLLAGVDRARAGAVRWEGGAPRPSRAGLGLALDDSPEEETLSGRQAAVFWCRRHVRDRDAARRLVDAALQRFGLDAVADEPVGAYSYGMRRRLTLVEALAHRPRLVLLDEPSAGLDPGGVAALVGELRNTAAAGRAAVVAGNDPALLAAACDRIALLDAGLVVRCATVADLLAAAGAGPVAELTIDGTPDLGAFRAVPGVTGVVATGTGAVVRHRDASVLPAVVAAADTPGSHLRGLRVREPDLRDCFAALAGPSRPGGPM